MKYAYGVLIFSFGLYVGFFLRAWLFSRQSYTGTLKIFRNEKKTVYSLELEEYPEEIVFKKEVVFKVDAEDIAPEESSDRD